MTDDIPPDFADDVPTELDLGIDVATAPELEDSDLGAVLEALLLVVDTPVSTDSLASATEQPAYRVAAKLQLMAEELTARDSGIDLREAGGGWRMYTRARFAPYVERLLLDGARSKLTRAALETVAAAAAAAGAAGPGECGAWRECGCGDAHTAGARPDHRGGHRSR